MSHWPECSNIKIMSNMQPIKYSYGGWNDKPQNPKTSKCFATVVNPPNVPTPDRGEVKFVSAGRMARQPGHKHEQHH